MSEGGRPSEQASHATPGSTSIANWSLEEAQSGNQILYDGRSTAATPPPREDASNGDHVCPDGGSPTAAGPAAGGFGWGVNAEDSAASVRQQHQRQRRQGRSSTTTPTAAGAAASAVDDPAAVKKLTSQVESSSITTRNGAIQREMQDAYRKLICANVERKDVASFSTFLVGVRVRLHEKGSNLRRRHSVLSSLLKHAPRARVQRIYSDLAAVEEQECALSKDVDLFNKLQQDLKESPAYKAMMEYGNSAGMVNVDGTMMPDPRKHPELEAMASMSVKDMLAEFKKEDKRKEENGLRNGSQRAPPSAGGRSSSAANGIDAHGDTAPSEGSKNRKGKKGKKDRRR